MLKLYLAAGAAAAVLALGWYARHEHGRADKAQAVAEAQSRQATLNGAVTEAADTAHRTEVIVRTQSEKAVEHVQKAPGADQPVPPDVLGAWRAGVDGLRHSAPDADNSDPAKPAG